VTQSFGRRFMHHKAKPIVQFDGKIVPSKSYAFIGPLLFWCRKGP
jgi:hypothetical protein